MADKTGELDETVDVSVELSGKYREVMEIVGKDVTKYDALSDIPEDFEVVLDTIGRLNGGTKSQIESELPGTLSVELTVEELVPVLRVLETYGLVTLDGNTWKRSADLDEGEE